MAADKDLVVVKMMMTDNVATVADKLVEMLETHHQEVVVVEHRQDLVLVVEEMAENYMVEDLTSLVKCLAEVAAADGLVEIVEKLVTSLSLKVEVGVYQDI